MVKYRHQVELFWGRRVSRLLQIAQQLYARKNQGCSEFHEALFGAEGGARCFITDTRGCLCFSFIKSQGKEGLVIYRPTTWWQLDCLRWLVRAASTKIFIYPQINQPSPGASTRRRVPHWEQQGPPEGSHWSLRLSIQPGPDSRLGPSGCKENANYPYSQGPWEEKVNPYVKYEGKIGEVDQAEWLLETIILPGRM